MDLQPISSLPTLCVAPSILSLGAIGARGAHVAPGNLSCGLPANPPPPGLALRKPDVPALMTLAPVAKPTAQTIEVAKGTFNLEFGWTTNDIGVDALRGRVSFTPKAGVAQNDDIGFVQIARVEVTAGDYDWPGEEAPRNVMRTKADPTNGVEGGFYIDHQAAKAATLASPKPFFRDYWPNDDESADGVVKNGQPVRPASMVDYPYGWDTMNRISLQACAVGRSTGTIYGCVRWGAEWPLTGPRVIFKAAASDAPTATWKQALRNFDAFYAKR
jgi:hypothetical protein